MNIRRVLAWLAPIVALGALAWAGRHVGWQTAWSRVQALAGWQIALIVAFPLTYYLVTALRLSVILKYLGSPVRFGTLAELTVASFAASYLLPSFDLAGKSVKFAILRAGERVSAEKTVAALSVEAIVGSGADIASRLAIFLALGLTAFLNQTVFKIALLASAAFAIVFVSPLLPPSVVRKIIRRQKVLAAYEALRGEYLRLVSRPRQLGAIAAISLASFGLGFLEFEMVSAFLGLPLDPKTLFLVFTAFHTAWLVPTSGGIGTVEGAMLGIFWTLGKDPVWALSIAMTFRLKEFFWVLVGLVLAARNGVKIWRNAPSR